MVVEIIVSVPVIADNEGSFGPFESLSGRGGIVHGLVSSQSNDVQNIEVVKGGGRRRPVHPGSNGEFLCSIMSVTASCFGPCSSVSLRISLGDDMGLPMPALNGHIAVGRRVDSCINVGINLIDGSGVHDVFC